jgi:hypothetical protein
VRQVFVLPTLGENVAARSRDSILKNVLATGTPVEDHALEFATLAQALNLLTKFDPDERQVRPPSSAALASVPLEGLSLLHDQIGYFSRPACPMR